jgi:hypothetical protein
MNHLSCLVPGKGIARNGDHSVTIRRPLPDGLIGTFKRSRRQPDVITAATETPRGKRSHAVGAHVAEGRGGGRIAHAYHFERTTYSHIYK